MIKSTLEDREKTKIGGFGSFEVKQKNDSIGSNPQTGESLIIEARRILAFKTSNVLRTAINQE